MAYLVELTAPQVVDIREHPVPEVGPGEVGIRTQYSGISAGTELATYRGTNPYLEKRWDPDHALFVPGGTSDVAMAFTIALLPIAAGIAILRYRLYDIDRLISRTLVYGLLTGLLAGVYAGVVLVLGQVFGVIGTEPPS